MSLTSNFDKLKKGKVNEARTPKTNHDEMESYTSAGNARNLCFIQPNGESLFLNYAYLISGAFSSEGNAIILTYTTHTVTLKGQNLDSLLDELMQQKPRKIICVEARYAGVKEKTEVVVTEIVIQGKES